MAQVINNVGQNDYLPYKPIQFWNGAPTGQDYAEVGHIGVDMVANVAYIAANQVNGLQTWIACGAAVGGATAALTIAPGDLTITAGNATITAGNLTVAAGSITATVGAIAAGTTVTAGTSIAATTSIAAGTSILAGTTITSTTGNITATNGNFVATAADTGLQLGAAGPVVVAGTGAPGALAHPKGSIYINTTGNSVATRLYVATGVGTWTAVTTVS